MTSSISIGLDGLLLLVAFAWGTTYWAAKQIVSVQSISTFLALRFGGAAIISLSLLRGAIMRCPARTWLNGCALGLLLVLSIAVETLGISLTSATNAGVLISLTIIFVPFLETVADPRCFQRRILPVAALSFLGCTLLAFDGHVKFSVGDVLVLSAAVTRAIHLIFSARLKDLKEKDTGALNAIQFGMVGICALLVSLATGHLPSDLAHTDLKTASLLVYMILICTVFAFFVQMTAVRLRPASYVGLLLGTEPLFAAFVGTCLGGETLSPVRLLGVALIVSATYWGQSMMRKPKATNSLREIAAC